MAKGCMTWLKYNDIYVFVYTEEFILYAQQGKVNADQMKDVQMQL
jgi:hypothetical protein